MPEALPDVPEIDWNLYQSDLFVQRTDHQIKNLPLHVAPLRDDWMKPGAFAPPTPSDSLTNPTMQPSAGPETASLPSSVPSLPEPTPSAAPALPAPTDFHAAATAQIDALPQTGQAAPSATAGSSSSSPDLVAEAMNAADRAGVDPSLFVSQIQQESNFNPRAQSPAGAQGLGQLMPDTARSLGVTDPFDPIQNLKAAATYMRQNIDRFGGDVVKGLAAYNAGPGAVEQYGGVPPYKETQRYVNDIFSRIQSEATPTDTGYLPGPTEGLRRVGSNLENQQSDISQFGDPQLTADEAYSACGPAAAVRFAQKFGRNPTLREATDLAKQVGWSTGQGMAGLGSEQALMDKLGVPTKLASGPQWDVFSKEAQTGNPVTISTAGHYFTADGYDPNTAKFHVGRSGLDLKGGAEWMSGAQMTALMGDVQGGLLADNPQVPSPSTADQTSNPAGWLDKAKGALTGAWDTVSSAVGNAVSGASTQPAGMPASMQPTPSDTLTNPPLQSGGPDMNQPPPPQRTVFDQAGDAAANLPMPTMLSGGLNLASGNRPAVAGEPTMPGAMDLMRTYERGRVADDQRANDLQMRARNGEAISESDRQWLGDYYKNAALAVAGADVNVPEGIAGKLAGKPGAYQSVMPAGTFDASTSAGSAAPLSDQMIAARDAVSRNLTRALFDRQVDINQVQQAYAKALGRPLNADEMAAELQRLSPDASAAVKIDEGLKPAIQSVGDDYQALKEYVTLRSNVEVAQGAGVKVREAGMARDVPVNLRDDLNAANTSLRMRQQALDNLQNASVPDQARIQGANRAVNSAQRMIQRRQDAIDVWQQANTQAASTAGAEAALNRKFSGGLNRDQSQQLMQDMEAQLGPDRFQKVKTSADQVTTFNKGQRQRLVDSGVLSADQAAQLDAMYPNWAKMRVLDYMADPAGGQGAGTKIGLSDRGLREYTLQGTEKAREDPLASTVAYAHRVERMANKNEAFNAFLKMDQASPTPYLRKVPQDFTPTNRQVTVTGFVNGEKVKYVTDNKAVGEAINGSGVMSVPEWTSAWQKVFRSLATSRNPVFLAGNAALDIPTYTFRTAIRDGGPQHLPGIMADLARGYGDAFQGLLQGEYRGTGTSAFLKGGGGQAGYFTGGEGQASQAISNLQRSNVFEIKGKADLLRLTKDLVTLKPVEALGERIELGPRVAAYNRALKRGANPVQAVIDGRTVTVDFSQGGTVTKYINNIIPFFNVGFQGPVQIARAFRDNPRAFVATTGTLIGLPTVAAEVWNRADPQRAKDYADVPQYVKDQGIVVMLPGEAPADAQGNRKPLYAVLKLREWAPIAAIAREATARALGDDSRNWAEMAQSIGTGLSPTQASSFGQLGSEALSGIPVVPAALQVEQNRDFFRSRDVVTNRNDTNASALAKSLTPAFQAVVDQLGMDAEIRPSAVDFIIRNQGAGVGGAISGASDLIAGKARQDTSPTSLPGVGGLVGRFVGNQTGQGMQTARDDGLTVGARTILRQNGITSTPGPVGSSINQIPINLEEETRYQQLANRYIDEAIHKAVQADDWGRLTQQGKDSRMSGLISGARERAGTEVLNTIPAAEKQRRLRTKSTAPNAPAAVGATR